MSSSPRRALGAAVFALVALAGCGSDEASDTPVINDSTGASSSTTAGGDRVEASTVVLKNIKFAPAEITVKKGDTVTWQWDDGTIPHDVDGGEFKSEVQEKGTFTHTFAEAGVFEYKCNIHSTMTGSVEVTE